MGVSTLSGWLGSFPLPLMVPGGNSAIAAELPARGTDLTPNQALQKLLDGNQRFVQRQRQNPHQDFSRLRGGSGPKALCGNSELRRLPGYSGNNL